YPNIERYKKKWKANEKERNDKKELVFNGALKTFDKKVTAYRKKLISLGEYLHELSIRTSGVATEVETFRSAWQLEQSLDWDRVQRERSLALDRLVRVLTKGESQELMAQGVAYRTGTLPHSQFYGNLRKLFSNKGVPLSDYPSLRDYLQYVLLSESIKPDQLFKEANALEKEAYDRLARSEKERELIVEARQSYLVGKLLDFSLTKEEWEEYKKVRGAQSVVRRRNIQYSNHALRTTDYGLPLSFESFYRHAEARDQAMAENLLAAIEKHDAKVTVLVAGGFHSKGIQHYLFDETSPLRTTDHGPRTQSEVRSPWSVVRGQPDNREAPYSVVSFIPKITKLDKATGSDYLSVFAQEKTPLEKLFKGETLFLPPPRWTAVLLARFHLLAQAVIVNLNPKPIFIRL
ncbi:hypothetical protein BVX98_03110, partial [bacterium F11]